MSLYYINLKKNAFYSKIKIKEYKKMIINIINININENRYRKEI
jgi:hypothetical protein